MKKSIIAFLIGLFSVSSLNAKIIFDLQDQYFENSYKQDQRASLYDLKNIQLGMNNVYQDKTGEYCVDREQSGTIKAKLKKELENFSITANIKITSGGSNRTSMIVLTSINGNQEITTFEHNKISIGKDSFKVENLDGTSLNILITRLNKTFKFTINGQTFKKSENIDFDSLKTVEITLNSGDHNSFIDYLYNFSIISK